MTDINTTIDVSPTPHRKWIRRLRVAVSVFFGLLTVAICVLWVRSFWNSGDGTFAIVEKYTVFYDGASGQTAPTPSGRRVYSPEDSITIPFWVLAILSAAMAPLVWLQPSSRFSLRTLLITTTLVAVVLGLLMRAVK